MAEAAPEHSDNLDVEAVNGLDGAPHTPECLPSETDCTNHPECQSFRRCLDNESLHLFLENHSLKCKISCMQNAELLVAQEQLESAGTRLKMYGANTATLLDSRKDFEDAKKNAELAYHKCSDPIDKADAVRIFSFAVLYLNHPAAPEFAVAACIEKIRKLHEVPEVQEVFASLNPQPKSWLSGLSFTSKPDPKDIIKAVCQVNVLIYNCLSSAGLIKKDFAWPCINTTSPLDVAYNPKVLPQPEPLFPNSCIPDADYNVGIKVFSITGENIMAVTNCCKMVVKANLDSEDTPHEVLFQTEEPFKHAIQGPEVYCFLPIVSDQGQLLEGNLTTVAPTSCSEEWITLPLPEGIDANSTKIVHMNASGSEVRFITTSNRHAMFATYDTLTKEFSKEVDLKVPPYMLPLKEGQCCSDGDKVMILYLNANHGDMYGRIRPGLYVYELTEGRLIRDDYKREETYKGSFDGKILKPSGKHLLVDLLKSQPPSGVRRSLIALDADKLEKLFSTSPLWKGEDLKCCTSPDNSTLVLVDNNYLSVWDLLTASNRSIRYKPSHDDRIRSCLRWYDQKYVIQAFENTLEMDKIQIVT